MVFLTVIILCIGVAIALIAAIPSPNDRVLDLICGIGKLLLIFGAIIIGCIVGALASAPIWNRAHTGHRMLKQQLRSDACKNLREHYELQEPCIVPKCYDSSEKRFVNHDVCLFIAGDELRITANLIHGFFTPKTI